MSTGAQGMALLIYGPTSVLARAVLVLCNSPRYGVQAAFGVASERAPTGIQDLAVQREPRQKWSLFEHETAGHV
jgi:hypothetical protein